MVDVMAAATRGDVDMAYETKALFIAIANIMRLSKDMNQAYEALMEMANAEGVILKPLDEKSEIEGQ